MKTENWPGRVVPIYLIACVALGGSAQGIWVNMALQLMALAILVWAAVVKRPDELTRASRLMLALAAIAGLLIAAQLVPLPPGVWTKLPGREVLADGYEMLGYPLPSQPLSMAPYATLASGLAALPALAMLVATVRVGQRESWLAGALMLAVFAGVLVGALQVASGGPDRSPWYFYPYSNHGAVGFFANSNHLGSLLLVSIPFAMALFTSLASRARERAPRGGAIAIGAAALLVIAAGIALNRSLAAVGLAVPVLLLSMLLLPATFKIRRLALVAGTLALVGCVLFLTGSPISAEASEENLRSFESRSDIWVPTLELIRQTFPFGTGLGSFESAYQLTEASAQINRVYVNHAHNDYLELVADMGLAGVVLLLAFLAWWITQVARVWRSSLSTSYARAATIASGALLAHSIVDYPLRTAALSAIFAMCLGLMAQPRRVERKSDDAQARPTKHLTIG